MFSKLHNEAVICFDMKTESPLFIDSGESDQLDPTAKENTFLKVYRNGQLTPVIPGSSLKGVFRSTAEQLLDGSCNILGRSRCGGARRMRSGEEKYRHSCPVCKLFGSTALKSRISFKDAYPIGEAKTGYRASVAIDRITGAAKGGSLYDFEYVEDGIFAGEIRIKNFFRWHIKLLLEILDRIDEGYVAFGGLTSKGFGQMKIDDISICLRYYDMTKLTVGYENKGFYMERLIENREQLDKSLKDVFLQDNKTLQESRLKNDKAI